MNTFFVVSMFVYMIAMAAAVLYRIVRDTGVQPHALTHGRCMVGALGVLIFGALFGAALLFLIPVSVGYLNEFAHTQIVIPTIGPKPTLVNLLALLLFSRLICDGIDWASRLIERESKKAEATP